MDENRLARGSFYIFLNRMTVLGLKVLLALFLARLLGPAGYGRYSIIFAFCAIVQTLFESGLSGSIVKTLASERTGSYYVARFGFITQFFWSGAVFLVVFLGARFWTEHLFGDTELTYYLRVASLYFVPFALFGIGYSILIARKKFGSGALYGFGMNVLRMSLMLVFLIIWRSVDAVFFAIFIASCLAVIPAFFILKGLEKSKVAISKKRILAVASSLVVSALAVRAIINVDKIFVKNMLHSDEITGIYSLASNFSLILQVFTFSLMTTLFPSVSRSYSSNETALTSRYLRDGTRYMLMVLLPLAFSFLVLGKDLIGLLLGEQYLGSIAPFSVLIFGSAFFAFFMLYRQILVSIDRYWSSAVMSTGLLAAAIALNPLLIGRFGFMGAAWATFTCSVTGAVVSSIILFRATATSYPWLSLLRILGGAFICFFLAVLASPLPIAVRYALYFMLFCFFWLALYVTGELRKGDWTVIKKIFLKYDRT